jgi:hypothetical protein
MPSMPVNRRVSSGWPRNIWPGHGLTDQSCRFDVLLYAGESVERSAIEHIENAFDVPGEQLQW